MHPPDEGVQVGPSLDHADQPREHAVWQGLHRCPGTKAVMTASLQRFNRESSQTPAITFWEKRVRRLFDHRVTSTVEYVR